MKIVLGLLVLLVSPVISFASEDGYTPGPVMPKEEVTLLGAGFEDVGVCIADVNGYQLDSGFTRTGSIVVKKENGEEAVVNISMPLTAKAGFDEAIVESKKIQAEKVCESLAAAKGEKIFVTLQNFSEEDEGEILNWIYLREVEIPKSSFKFKNDSEVYLRFP